MTERVMSYEDYSCIGIWEVFLPISLSTDIGSILGNQNHHIIQSPMGAGRDLR